MSVFILLQADSGYPDLWKTLIITLLILSMINERLSNFVKLNISYVLARMIGLKRYEELFNSRTNFSIPEDDPEKEKKRERGIMNWAIVSGFLVSLFTGADLVYMIKNSGNFLSFPNLTELTMEETFASFGRHFFGLLLTTFFISLGSKFWHDLLDVVLYTSNLKRKLTEKDDWSFTTADEVNSYVNSYETDAIQNAITANQAMFNAPGVLGYGVKKASSGKYYIEVLTASDTVVIQPSITYVHPTGKVRAITVRKIVTGIAMAALEPAVEIGNTATKKFGGTLGCMVKRIGTHAPLMLTCYHVVKPGDNQPWEGYDRGKWQSEDQIESPDDSRNIIGRILEGRRNLTTDIAVLEPMTREGFRITSVRAPIPKIGFVNKSRKLTDQDLNKTTVNKVGIRSTPSNIDNQKTTGKVVNRDYTRVIRYVDGEFKMFGLLQIRSSNSDPFAQLGDSGSLVVDENLFGVGVVVAVDNEFAYALPLDDVFNQFSLEFYTPTTV